jgi:xanthine/uracil permease
MEAKNKYNWRLILGPVLLLGGIILGLFWEGMPSVLVSILTAMGTVFIVVGIRMMKYGDSAKGDERTRKIWAYSAAYSWWLTYIAIAALYLVDYLKIVELNVGMVLGILLFTIAITQIIINWILSRKGDIR